MSQNKGQNSGPNTRPVQTEKNTNGKMKTFKLPRKIPKTK